MGSLSFPHPETDRPGSLSDLALETIQFAGLSFDPASLCEPLLLTYRWLRPSFSVRTTSFNLQVAQIWRKSVGRPGSKKA